MMGTRRFPPEAGGRDSWISMPAGTPAYITVAGMERPKLELKDDPQRSGVLTLTFTVHNTTDAALTYKAYPIVITDDTTTYHQCRRGVCSDDDGDLRSPWPIPSPPTSRTIW